jgi:tetratricopeptide (TPR) repeat protein
MNLDLFQQALELKRVGNFSASIAIYQKLKQENPGDYEIYKALGKVYYLDRQFEKSMASYFIAFHLCASNEFKRSTLTEEAKGEFITAFSVVAQHLGASQLTLDLESWRTTLTKYFDMDRNLYAYSESLMGRKAQLNEEFFVFIQNRGFYLYDKFIDWPRIVLKSDSDIKNMIEYYESMCSIEQSYAA